MAVSDPLLDALHIVSNTISNIHDIEEILDLTKLYFTSPARFRDAVVSSERADHKNRNHLIRSVRNGNVAWAKKVIQLLDIQPMADLKSDDFLGKECYVCYEPFEENHIVYKLPCRGKHIFHKECICKWVSYNSSCPYCRDPISIDDISTFLNRSSETEKSVLYYAIKKGDLDFVKDLIQKGAKVQYNDASPLHLSAGFRHKEMVDYFLEQGTEVDICDRYGHTPLWYASNFGGKDVIEALLCKGGNPKLHYFNEELDHAEDTTILHLAIKRKCTNGTKWLVDYFLSHNLSIDEKDSNHQTPLAVAAYHHFLELVHYLLQKGVTLGGEIDPKHHPLFSVMQNRSYDKQSSQDIFELLLEVMDGMYMETEEKDKYLAFLCDLVRLAFNNDYDTYFIVKLLKRFDVKITPDMYPYIAKFPEKTHLEIGKSETYCSDPAFFFACVRGGHIESIRLIEKISKLDINQRDADGNTAIHLTDNIDTLNCLVTSGFALDFTAVNNKRQTPIHKVFEHYDLSGSELVFSKKIVERYPKLSTGIHTLTPHITQFIESELEIQQGPFPRGRLVVLRRRDQVTPPDDEEEEEDFAPPVPRVKKVVAKLKSDIIHKISFFHSKGVNLNAQDKLGLTPLQLALAQGSFSCARHCIVLGADMNHVSSYKSPYELALKNKGTECKDFIEFLLEQNVPLDLSANELMHYAFANAYHELIDKLVAKGVSLNSRDSEGFTPLFKLLQNFSSSAQDDITIFKNKGYVLDMNLPLYLDNERYKDCVPLYPLQLAADCCNDKLLQLMVDYGATLNIQDHRGWTALHYACYKNNKSAISYLIEKGCDTTIQDNDGHEALYYKKDETPLDLLRQVNQLTFRVLEHYAEGEQDDEDFELELDTFVEMMPREVLDYYIENVLDVPHTAKKVLVLKIEHVSNFEASHGEV